MTDRLYYTDPYLRAFDATIDRVEQRDGRVARHARSHRVLSHLRRPAVRHRHSSAARASSTSSTKTTGRSCTSSSRPELLASQDGDAVHGEIDWARRFDHMQQHTGQHVLSAAFDRLFGVRTVSFHLGAAAVDDRSGARAVAGRDRRGRDRGEPHRLGGSAGGDPLRDAPKRPRRCRCARKPARGGTLRLIDVDGFDLSACGGTHVARTGGIGVIAVASWERFKGGQRVAFLCGGRALAGYRAFRDAVTAIRAAAVGAAGRTARRRSIACRRMRRSRSARSGRCRSSWPATVQMSSLSRRRK